MRFRGAIVIASDSQLLTLVNKFPAVSVIRSVTEYFARIFLHIASPAGGVSSVILFLQPFYFRFVNTSKKILS